MLVAQAKKRCEPESSNTVTSEPLINDGASLTGETSTDTMALSSNSPSSSL